MDTEQHEIVFTKCAVEVIVPRRIAANDHSEEGFLLAAKS